MKNTKEEEYGYIPSHNMTLKELRESFKLSQSEVEKKSMGQGKNLQRIPQTTLSGWEKGNVGLQEHEMITLAAIYGVHPLVVLDACHNTRKSILS